MFSLAASWIILLLSLIKGFEQMNASISYTFSHMSAADMCNLVEYGCILLLQEMIAFLWSAIHLMSA